MVYLAWLIFAMWPIVGGFFLSFFCIGNRATFGRLKNAKTSAKVVRIIRNSKNLKNLEKAQRRDAIFLPLYSFLNILQPIYVYFSQKLPSAYLAATPLIFGFSIIGYLVDRNENKSIQRVLGKGKRNDPDVLKAAAIVKKVQVIKVVAFLTNFWVGAGLTVWTYVSH